MSSWQEATCVRAPPSPSPSLPRMINFPMRRWIFGGRCFRWHEQRCSLFHPFCCNLNVEAVDISFFMGTHSAFHERLWFDFAGWLKDSFLGYDLRVLPSPSFFVDEEVEILCRQFPIVFTKEYIDVYNDEDKRHLCEDAGSFLTPLLLSTICIHDCVDQIRWVWGFSHSLSLSLSRRLEVALKPSRLTRAHTHTRTHAETNVQYVESSSAVCAEAAAS